MSFAQNVSALLFKYNISQNAFASAVGVTPPTVSRWLNTNMSVRKSTLARICSEFDVTPEELLSDTEGLYTKVFGQQASCTVPFYPSLATYPDRGGDLGPTSVEVPVIVPRDHPAAFAAPAPDDAMDRVIPSGATVVIDPDAKPGPNSIVVVEVFKHEAPTLRRWLRGNTTLVLATDNAAHTEDIVLSGSETNVRLIGVVVWYQAPAMLS